MCLDEADLAGSLESVDLGGEADKGLLLTVGTSIGVSCSDMQKGLTG